MKQILLSGLLIASSFFAQAQFTQTYDFSTGGAPAGWTPEGLPVGDYSYDPGTGCVEDRGLILRGPITPNGLNLMSNVYQSIDEDSRINITLDLYVLTNTDNCETPVAFPCATNTAKLYVVSPDFNGQGEPTPSQTYAVALAKDLNANTQNTLFATVEQSFVGNRDFRIYIVTNSETCQGTGDITVVIDNLTIEAVPETVTPVSLKSFSAVRKKSNVALSWTTASEQNNRGFYIQKNEGNGWKDVSFIFSQADGGNSASDLDYSYSDINNSKAITQYRLMQVDIDGKAKVSDIRSVRGEDQAARIVVYPNPSHNGDVFIVFDSQTSRDVQVSDISGRLVKQYKGVVNTLPIQGLKTGVYTIRIADRTSGATVVEKVVVK